MGYCTDYRLDVSQVKLVDGARNFEPVSDELGRRIREELDKQEFLPAGDAKDFFYGSDSRRDHDSILIGLSKRFRNVLFVLQGAGDHRDDNWFTYYYKGKMQYAPVVMEHDDFDETKLEALKGEKKKEVTMDRKEELEFLLNFAEGTDFEESSTVRNQLRALWTAYCIHADLNPDTFDYDQDIMSLWVTLCDNFTNPFGSLEYMSFENIMAKHLV